MYDCSVDAKNHEKSRPSWDALARADFAADSQQTWSLLCWLPARAWTLIMACPAKEHSFLHYVVPQFAAGGWVLPTLSVQ